MTTTAGSSGRQVWAGGREGWRLPACQRSVQCAAAPPMPAVACSNYCGAAASYESAGARAGVRWCVLCCVCGTSCAGMPCERFAAGPGLPPCKVNELRWCQTDLAANAYAWPRFIADDMRFGVLDSGHGANHDGYMADVVRTRQWKVGVLLHRPPVGVSNPCMPVWLLQAVSFGLSCLAWVRQMMKHHVQDPSCDSDVVSSSSGVHQSPLCRVLTGAAGYPFDGAPTAAPHLWLSAGCCRSHALKGGAWWTTPPAPRHVPQWTGSGTTRQQAQTQEQAAGGLTGVACCGQSGCKHSICLVILQVHALCRVEATHRHTHTEHGCCTCTLRLRQSTVVQGRWAVCIAASFDHVG